MKRSVEQILQLALQQAEKEAPPAPSVEWFESKVEPWWQRVRRAWASLCQDEPELVPVGVGNGLWETELMKPTQKIRTIPAGVLREDRMDNASVEVTQPPAVNDEGHLILTVRVREVEGILDSGEILELILLAEGKPVGEPLKLCVVEEAEEAKGEENLDLRLPPELQKAWQGIEKAWQDKERWKEIRFRFVLRPDKEKTKVLKAEAAGAQNQRKNDWYSEHNFHRHQLANWTILLTLVQIQNLFYAFVFRSFNRYRIYNLAIQQEIDALRFSSFFTRVLPLLSLLGFESLKPVPKLSSSVAKIPASARYYPQMNSHSRDPSLNLSKKANKQHSSIS